MPVVRISFFQGRSVAQKREIAEVVTDALARIAGSNRAGVHVIFDEVSRDNWVIGGAPDARPKAGEA